MQKLFGNSALCFLGAAILCPVLSSCSDPDSSVKRFDRSHWPDAVVGTNGVLDLSLPHELATKYSAEKKLFDFRYLRSCLKSAAGRSATCE